MATLNIKKAGPELSAFTLHMPSGRDVKLMFGADGASSTRLQEKGQHVVAWIVRGPRATSFSYTVMLDETTLEEEADGKISDQQWEGGFISFEVKS